MDISNEACKVVFDLIEKLLFRKLFSFLALTRKLFLRFKLRH